MTPPAITNYRGQWRQLTPAEYAQVADLLPRQGGNVRLDNQLVLNAILYVAAHRCQWRALPTCYGKWNTVYVRMMRWRRAGVLDQVFARLHSPLPGHQGAPPAMG